MPPSTFRICREDAAIPNCIGGLSRIFCGETREAISIRLDQDVLEWFRGQGPGYQTRMNAVLRSYMEAMSLDDH